MHSDLNKSVPSTHGEQLFQNEQICLEHGREELKEEEPKSHVRLRKTCFYGVREENT